MKKLFKFIGIWALVALFMAALGTIFQTQNLLARLGNVGADIEIGQRLSMTLYDLMHFAPHYLVPIAVATFVAWLAGLLVYRLAGFGRPVVFIVAGVVAMVVLLWGAKQAFFGIDIVGGSRDTVGYLFQLLAGGLGGLLFARLTRRPV